MTGFDIVVVGVVALSALLAYVRGVVRELIALVTWIAGIVLGLAFAEPVAAVLPRVVEAPALRYVIAFALLFVAVFVAGALVARLLTSLVRAAGLGFADRFLGALFGLARGALIVLVGILVAGLTGLPRHEWWQNAALAPPLVAMALALSPWLPGPWAERLDYGPTGRLPVRPRGEAARWIEGESQQCAES
jgi:membrane protein required for colicin V production